MRLLLAEDQRRVCSIIADSLRENLCSVDLASTSDKALEMAANNVYDLILLEARLPKRGGSEVCREIRYSGIETPVLMLAARSLVEQRIEGLDAGADDFLTGPFAMAELHARVRALTRRNFYWVGVRLHAAGLQLDRFRRTARRGMDHVALSGKEFALLELLLLRSPEPVARAEMVAQLWPGSGDAGSNLVEVYINRLRRKIDTGRGPNLIHTLRGLGYRLGIPNGEQGNTLPGHHDSRLQQRSQICS